MNWMVVFAVLLCTAVGAGLLWLVWQIGSVRTSLPVTADWIDRLALNRYDATTLRLDAPDAQFSPAQPGLSRRMARRLRRQRCCVFCQYLRCLQVDFRRVTTAIRVLLVQSRYDRPDLARVLVRREAQFAVMMAAIHVRLFLYRWGYGGVDATGLVQAFDSQRLELRALLPAAAVIPA